MQSQKSAPRRTALWLVLVLTLLLAVPAPAFASTESLPFADVPGDAWFEPAVRYAYENGVVEGKSADAFDPNGTVTCAEFLTMVWRTAGSPVVNHIIPFSDVAEDAWYADAVRWAVAERLIEGAIGSTLDPDAPLLREETVSLLYRFAAASGRDVSIGEDTNILSYDDALDVGSSSASAMQWAVGSGVVEGDGSRLLPKRSVTRAEAVTMLMRLLNAGRTDALSLWTESARAANELTAYLRAVTDETSEDFIPVRDRIAVFDLDGTLFCETDPNYFDYTLLVHRVLEDPDYIDRASDFEKETANKIVEQNKTGKSFSGLEIDHGKAIASSFAGMTVAEFNAYIQEFKKLPMPSYEGMTRGGGFYLPMVQVVEALQANGFTVYVVSGTDRLIVRGILANSVLDIPNRQIIGSDETIVSSNQGTTPGLNYVFREGDELVLGGDFLIKNLKMNKVSVIMQEIGQQPVLSFGNSTGDSSMAEYVTSGNPYRSLAFMLCCDDTERENGNVSKADKMAALCEEFDWVPVSMKNDWTTIYGDGVRYTGAN